MCQTLSEVVNVFCVPGTLKYLILSLHKHHKINTSVFSYLYVRKLRISNSENICQSYPASE